MTVMLVGATALATTDSAFAGKKKYEKNQAMSQAPGKECGPFVVVLPGLDRQFPY